MFAIVEIKGEQFKIDGTTSKLRVPFIKDAEKGSAVTIDRVIASTGKDGKLSMGAKLNLKATVAGFSKGEKLIVFHKKRRKGYRVKNGHQQKYTELNIEGFSV